MISLIESVAPVLHEVARGGGGGSGAGGGGGGSIIAFIGYIPAHFITAWINRRVGKDPAIVAGAVVGVIVTAPCVVLNGGFGFIVGLGAVIGVYSGVNDWWGKLARTFKKSRQQVESAALKDSAWDEAALEERVRQVFADYQQDWSDFNFAHMKKYLSPAYYGFTEIFLRALQQMGRQNQVMNPAIQDLQFVAVQDEADNDADAFRVYLKAKADDRLIDTAAGTVIYEDTSSFRELWRFDREGNTWLLHDIQQVTADGTAKLAPLQQFAEQNGMFYSLDMGWLLLPQHGQLFGKAKFKHSDVNNHVIGDWKGNIVMLYTYLPNPKNTGDTYVIGQLQLPKSYGGIIVKRRASGYGLDLFNIKPRGYNKVSFEWPDFNKRYNVYATDVDQVTSFELLNPSFMADLYDRNLPVNIEVVDNVVYLYAKVGGATTRYAEMLDVLQRAFKELRM
ncbi:MAG TPA: TIM44-like domain-containing protein [Candidatus Saccharimonadales bacterium]|nr:TIM44-like domain-containing protein [Candidatus Saccharimonadales bacterium]